MAQALFIRLDRTLLDATGQALPDAVLAVETLAGFENDTGNPLPLALLGDPPESVRNEEADRVRHVSDPRPDFESLQAWVVPISGGAAPYPGRAFFVDLLTQLGIDAPLTECIIICHELTEAASCRALGLKVLRFALDAPDADLTDWSNAPLGVARRLFPHSDTNLERALSLSLDRIADVESCRIETRHDDGSISLAARRWCPIRGPELGNLDGVSVSLPVHVDVVLGAKAGLGNVEAGDPDPAMLSEARFYIASLDRAGRIAAADGSMPAGATHRVTVDERGRRRLVRERMSRRL